MKWGGSLLPGKRPLPATVPAHHLVLHPVAVEVAKDDVELQVDLAHGHSVQSVAVGPGVDQVAVFQLGATANKHLGQLLLPGAQRPPGDAVHLVEAWAAGDVAETVAVELAPAKGVLVPDLQEEFGPALETFGCIVHINRM